MVIIDDDDREQMKGMLNQKFPLLLPIYFLDIRSQIPESRRERANFTHSFKPDSMKPGVEEN